MRKPQSSKQQSSPHEQQKVKSIVIAHDGKKKYVVNAFTAQQMIPIKPGLKGEAWKVAALFSHQLLHFAQSLKLHRIFKKNTIETWPALEGVESIY